MHLRTLTFLGLSYVRNALKPKPKPKLKLRLRLRLRLRLISLSLRILPNFD